MRFFIENQKVEKELEWVLNQLKLHMNGATTSQMEESGIHYRINYGVGIPHLKQLAKRTPASYELAERMWYSEVREMMLLAALIVPAEKMTEDICREWSKQISNKDLVERTAMFLWARIDIGKELLIEWVNCDNNYLKATALYTIGRQLQVDAKIDTPHSSILMESFDHAQDLFIVKALSFALRMKLRYCVQETAEIVEFASLLSKENDRNKQVLGQELLTEIDFINGK
ncbi:DNA alkylation repair protein [Carboxylicivirga sp. RSCT41]|uniref:DNA alkylation repair protein n=1 Tax=Carboxylicivirga agarovorans TaxID=3417570 RepID=UPI003D3387E0